MKLVISEAIKYVGVNDHDVDLFEGQYVVPNGMAYNSYLILDEKVAVMDTVDRRFTKQWLDNIKSALNGRTPDYLVIQHMEPDHSANIINFLEVYPEATVVGNEKTFEMIDQFFHHEIKNKLLVNDGDQLALGKHTLNFVFAPMVHWPEVMITYENFEKTLFSADAFGKFGALDVSEDWDDEARRYFIGIVGKYGHQVQTVLAKAATLDIQKILPLHGPILTSNLGHYLSLYNTWSSYEPEEDGIAIFYTSVYGHTKEAVRKLELKLRYYGVDKVKVYDLARTDLSVCVAEAFRYSKIVLATTTYNAGIYPFMEDFLHRLVERNFQNKLVGLIENGTWCPSAIRVMKNILSESNKIQYLTPSLTINSSLCKNDLDTINLLAKALIEGKVSNTQVKKTNQHTYVCKICGYVYEGDSLPEGFVCPLCKHPAKDFVQEK